MKNRDFSKTIYVDNTPSEVFETVLNVRAWWSGLYDESFTGESKKLGDEFSFRAGGGAHYSKQKLIELIPGKKAVWLVTDANLSFVDKPGEWKGTKISFDITAEGGKTKVVFTHQGLVPDFECYDSCAPAWSRYLDERFTAALKQTHAPKKKATKA